jgi:hypothetical protein
VDGKSLKNNYLKNNKVNSEILYISFKPIGSNKKNIWEYFFSHYFFVIVFKMNNLTLLPIIISTIELIKQ